MSKETGVFTFAHSICVAGNVQIKAARESINPVAEKIRAITITVPVQSQDLVDGALLLLRNATSEDAIAENNAHLKSVQDEIAMEGCAYDDETLRAFEDSPNENIKQKGQPLTNKEIAARKPLTLEKVIWTAQPINPNTGTVSFAITLEEDMPFSQKDCDDLVWLTLKDKFDTIQQALAEQLKRMTSQTAKISEWLDDIEPDQADELLAIIAKFNGVDGATFDSGNLRYNSAEAFNALIDSHDFRDFTKAQKVLEPQEPVVHEEEKTTATGMTQSAPMNISTHVARIGTRGRSHSASCGENWRESVLAPSDGLPRSLK